LGVIVRSVAMLLPEIENAMGRWAARAQKDKLERKKTS